MKDATVFETHDTEQVRKRGLPPATENQAQLNPMAVSAGAFTITVPAKTVVTVVG